MTPTMNKTLFLVSEPRKLLTKQLLTSSTETITTIIDRELRQMLITSTGQMMMEEAGGTLVVTEE